MHSIARTGFRTAPPRGRVRSLAIALAAAVMLAPQTAPAQGLFDFLFGGGSRPQQGGPSPAANFFADPFGLNQQNAAPPRPAAPSGGGRSAAFCVRTCDGKYFPISARNGTPPARMCQAFCPASPTKVFSGSSIETAATGNGERYADLPNAYAYRKALRADCTCNGRDPAGLAPVDLSQDTSLRSGDVVATADGLVAYTGVRLGAGQTPDFAPVADYPGLTPSLRAKLGEMKVAPISAEMIAETPWPASAADRTKTLPAPAAQAQRRPRPTHTAIN